MHSSIVLKPSPRSTLVATSFSLVVVIPIRAQTNLYFSGFLKAAIRWELKRSCLANSLQRVVFILHCQIQMSLCTTSSHRFLSGPENNVIFTYIVLSVCYLFLVEPLPGFLASFIMVPLHAFQVHRPFKVSHLPPFTLPNLTRCFEG